MKFKSLVVLMSLTLSNVGNYPALGVEPPESTTATPTGQTKPAEVMPAEVMQPEFKQPESKQPENKAAEIPAKTPTATPVGTAAKPKMLSGRIEELCSSTSLSLPIKWKSMKPVMDTSLEDKRRNLSGQAVVQSFPMDWRGSWSGPVTLYIAQFDKSRWDFDPQEADKEYRIMKPGMVGNTTVTFYQAANRQIYVEPCSVTFQGRAESSDSRNLMQQMGGQANSAMSQQLAAMMSNMPVMYVLHMGDLGQGTGITGNQLQAQILKNELRQLSPGVMEQRIVTYGSDRNPRTGKVNNFFSEGVLRFQRLSSNQLYLQAADVNYSRDGKFQTKYVLYGTLTKGAGGSAMPSFPGMSPLGNPQGGGNMMQQLQDMMKQMGGR